MPLGDKYNVIEYYTSVITSLVLLDRFNSHFPTSILPLSLRNPPRLCIAYMTGAGWLVGGWVGWLRNFKSGIRDEIHVTLAGSRMRGVEKT